MFSFIIVPYIFCYKPDFPFPTCPSFLGVVGNRPLCGGSDVAVTLSRRVVHSVSDSPAVIHGLAISVGVVRRSVGSDEEPGMFVTLCVVFAFFVVAGVVVIVVVLLLFIILVVFLPVVVMRVGMRVVIWVVVAAGPDVSFKIVVFDVGCDRTENKNIVKFSKRSYVSLKTQHSAAEGSFFTWTLMKHRNRKYITDSTFLNNNN